VLLSTHQTEDVVALAQQVLVLHLGKLRFAGTPVGLAGLASGHVWQSQGRDLGALAAWRTGTGQYRNIGDPPAGADLLEPALEDGYLLLLGGDQVGEAAA
jgi:ABC-2 type transport system ATP-binding protein